jgi:D-glycero-alpha-D-manno-heptose-7-phosphate kinase
MIISKTPFRISLFGGGSDFPSYYKNNKASVIGFAFNRYNYILFRTRYLASSPYKYHINYSLNEKTNLIEKIKHRSVRETLKYFSFREPFEIHYNGELPARTGLGSSSAFTVGLCNILNLVNKKKVNNFNLAKQAIDIEQNKIKEFVGSQDQILTSIGGFNKIDFNKNKIRVNRFNLKNNNISQIEDSSIILFTGEVRTAEKIESDKFRKLTNKKIKLLDQIVEITDSANKILKSDNFKVKEIGELLDDSWKLKRSIHKSVSSKKIDEIYQYSKEIGVYGAKILGAGGGGFLYLLCPKNKKEIIKEKLNKFNVIDVKISNVGSEIISLTPEYK